MFSSSGDCCAKNAGGIRVVFPLPGVADTMRLMRGLPKMRAICGSMGRLGRSGIFAGRFELSFDFAELSFDFAEVAIGASESSVEDEIFFDFCEIFCATELSFDFVEVAIGTSESSVEDEIFFDFCDIFCAFCEFISSNSELFVSRVLAFFFVERGVCFVVGFMDNRPGGDDFGSAQGRIFDADRAVMEHDDAFDNG